VLLPLLLLHLIAFYHFSGFGGICLETKLYTTFTLFNEKEHDKEVYCTGIYIFTKNLEINALNLTPRYSSLENVAFMDY
jgi:hypothetical protein